MKEKLQKINQMIARSKSELAYLNANSLIDEDYQRVVTAYNELVDVQDYINNMLEA